MDHLTELKERQLNKQLCFFSMAILSNLQLTIAISKLRPGCFLVPRSGCAVPAPECWDDGDVYCFYRCLETLFLLQMNAAMKMLLFLRMFSGFMLPALERENYRNASN